MVEVGYTEQEAAALIWQQEEAAKAFATRLELYNLLLVNSCFHVSLGEWLKMTRVMRMALVHVAQEHNRELESARKERERELQKQIDELRNPVRLPHPMPSALPKIMGV